MTGTLLGERYRLDHLIGRCAAGLAGHGFKPGDVLLMFAPNLPEWPIAALGALAAGSWQQHPAIGLGTDLRLSAPGWDAAALVVDEELVHLAAFPRTRPASP